MYLDKANELAQELNDRKKDLKEAMFDNKIALLNAFPVISDSPLGELTFAHVQVPFEWLDLD